MSGVERRFSDQENRNSKIESERERLATKADLTQVENRLLWRILIPVMVGIAVSIVLQVWGS